MRDPDPVPESRGSLVPPVRYPPTEIGVATPEPPVPPSLVARRRREPGLLRLVRMIAAIPLDLADALVAALRESRASRPG